jgi:hypothetical protein
VFLRSDGTAYLDRLLAQSLEGGSGWRQVIELYEHVHGVGITVAITIDRALIPPSTPQINRQRCARFVYPAACRIALYAFVACRGPRPIKFATIEREFRLGRTICSESWPGLSRLSAAFFLLKRCGKDMDARDERRRDAAQYAGRPLKTRRTRQKFRWDALGYPRRGISGQR